MRKIALILMLVTGCGGESFSSGFNPSSGLEIDGGDAAGGAATIDGDSGIGAGGKVEHAHGGDGSGGAQGSGGASTGGAPDSTGGALSATGGAGSGGVTSTGGTGSGGAPEKDGGCAVVTHHNGLGQTWQDCVALGTYDQAQAMKACKASDAAQCIDAQGCGAGTSVVIGYDVGTTRVVGAWGYAGYAKSFACTGALCGSCPSSGPTWD